MRVSGVALAVAAVAAVGLAVGLKAQTRPPSPPYRTVALERGTVVSTVRASGTLSPERQVLLSSASPGVLTELTVDINTPVRSGDVLARLDDAAAKTHLELAQADLAVAQRSVDIAAAQRDRGHILVTNAEAVAAGARADLEHATAVVSSSDQEFRRSQALARTGDAARVEVERTKAAAEQASSALAAARARVEEASAALAAAHTDVRVADAQLQNIAAGVASRQAAVHDAELQLDQMTIRAPFDGLVIDHTAVLGQLVSTQPGLFTVASDLGKLLLHTNVDEADIGRVAPGQEVSFTVDAFPAESFHGAVATVKHAPQVAQNVVTYDVVVAAENPEHKLLPGMTATTTITTGSERDALRTPLAALRFKPLGGASGSGDKLWTIDAIGNPVPHPVAVGRIDGVAAAITAADLKPGDAVIIGLAARPEEQQSSHLLFGS